MIAARGAFAVALLSVAAGCAELPDIAPGSCGNGVIDRSEDCDTFAPFSASLCRAPGTAGECHLDCRAASDGTRPSCPAGWGCDLEGICRAPSGAFGAPVEFKIGGVASLATGDFDGDGRADIVSRESLDVYGRSKLRFHYFDERGRLADTRLFPKLIASPVIADLSGDARSDIVFSDFRVGLLLGQADRGLVPETFGTYHVAGAKVRMLAVYDELIGNDSAILAVTTLQGEPGYYLPDLNGVLRPLATLPSAFDSLAGDPVAGDVFDDPGESPCRELIAAARGATTFSIVDVCVRPTETGIVKWRDEGLTTTIALVPPARVDAAPLVADIDGNGHLDVMLGAGGLVYVASSDGRRLSPAVPYRLALMNEGEISPDIPMPLAAGDFTADGKPDFVFRDRLLVSRNVLGSDLPRYEIAQPNLGVPWTEAKIIDLNANGKLDVVAASSGRLGIDFFNGSGSGRLTDFSIPTSGPVEHFAVADFDGDLIADLAFIESAASPSDRDAVMVSFGQLSGPPLDPKPVARVAASEGLSGFTETGRGNLIVSSRENVDGKEDGVLTLLSGSGDRIPIASLGISTLSTDGQLVNSSSLGLSLGALTAPDHNDLLVLATNDLERRDWQVWMVPALDRPTSRLQMLDWRLDPHLLPIDVVDGNAVLTWVGGVADLDGDGRDEAVWAMSKVDYEHCALVVIGAAPGTETLRVRTTIDLDEPCGRSDLALGDADGDDRIDIVLLTGGPGRPARKLLVLWNDGEGRFSSSSSAVINPTSDSPEAFTFLPSGLRRTVSFAYVTQSAIAIVEAAPARQFAAPRVLAPVVRGSGITAADVNGDGAADLVVAASGNLLLMKAELRTP